MSVVADVGRMVARLGHRLDAFALDLARDAGAVARDARGLATNAHDRATMIYRATPRAARLAQVAAALVARQRWLRLAAAARGHESLSDDDHRDLARRLTAAAGELRGGIAKLGQLASCRPDLIGAIWATELAALQDDVPPIEAAQIRARIADELGPIDEIFAELDDVPLAAASLAQVYAGVLRDGTRVAVKVQVPGIGAVIAADIAALRALAGSLGELPGVDLHTITEELARALTAELDYLAEADALRAAARGARVIIPQPIAHASTARVLTMTRVDGERLADRLDQMSAADRDRVLGALVGEIASEIFERGLVHADPHPGNILVTAAGELALVDFGCTLTLTAAERAAYARLVLAIGQGAADAAARELAALGFVADDPAPLLALARAIAGVLGPGRSVAELDWTAAFADQLAAARAIGGLVVPRSFVLLGRVLATLGGLLVRYRPAIELHALIARPLAAALAH